MNEQKRQYKWMVINLHCDADNNMLFYIINCEWKENNTESFIKEEMNNAE